MVMFSVDQIVISIWERSYVLSLYEVLRGSCPEQGVGGTDKRYQYKGAGKLVGTGNQEILKSSWVFSPRLNEV